MKDEIVQEGAPVLREHARAVFKKDIGSPELKRIIKKMRNALTKEPYGVALAAPQIGESLRLFVVAGRALLPDAPKREDAEKEGVQIPPDLVFINPEIIRRSRAKKEMSEGCLSVRGRYGSVLRHEKTSVRALDEHGNSFTRHGSGLLSQIFQHEIDHLDGILYIDKATQVGDEPEKEENER